MMPTSEIVGLIAGICTTYSFVPQVYKTWKTKEVKSLSLTMYSVFLFGVISWILFGILIDSYSVIIANSITLVLVGLLIFFKFRYRNN